MVPEQNDYRGTERAAGLTTGIETASLNDAVEMVHHPVIHAEGRSTHIMAVQFDPLESESLGIMRCIESREGSVNVPGYVDRSVLRLVEPTSPFTAETGDTIEILGSEEVVWGLPEYRTHDFLGFEDPVCCRIPADGPLHLYCTIPFYDAARGTVMYLGHAIGEDLRSLEMTDPVLGPVEDVHAGAKEPAIAPESSAGHRKNLVESVDVEDGTNYSVVRIAIAEEPGSPWEYGPIAFHPADDGDDWCGGHASPGPLLPPSFVDAGDRKRVGILNGREENVMDDERTRYGTFSIGLMIYDYEDGTVEWTSPEPLIRDPTARTITFASAFRQIDPTTGIVYAHVDDSFIRAYIVDAESLTSYLPSSVAASV
ncbi:hypothetical protein [Salinarchaeum sp. Harcht-Bsk1]|uniref:hypothetical protein n=1 Tax=Salinarchaeum sp. Harcht-Bsk1 TaxID=1333523 RepID=UPI000677D863|nr:hypothetical protein [Salinarchaeum sp. Harcht-Bsk1]